MDKQTFYLQTLQSLIARMGSNTFLVKGWSVTIVSAFIALAASLKSSEIVAFGFGPVFLLWALDSYYLMLERRFRVLFENGFHDNEPKLSFNHLSISKPGDFGRSLFSVPNVIFYLSIAFILAVAVYHFQTP